MPGFSAVPSRRLDDASRSGPWRMQAWPTVHGPMEGRYEVNPGSTLGMVTADALAVIEVRGAVPHRGTPSSRAGRERATYGPQTPAYSAVGCGIC